MYAGRLMERAPAASLFRAPRVPYTYGLLHCFPPMHGERKPMEGIPGSPPDLRALPSGCSFHPRCPWAMERCRKETPVLTRLRRLRTRGGLLAPLRWRHRSRRAGPGRSRRPGLVRRDQEGRTMSLTAQEAAVPPVSVAPVLEGRGLTKYFSVKHGRGIFPGTARLFAVDDVTIALAAGTVTALVGESGSGRPPSPGCWPRSSTPMAVWCCSTASRCRTGGPAVTRGRSRWSFRTPSPRSTRSTASATTWSGL